MIPRNDNKQAMAEAKVWCEYYMDYIAPEENCMEPMSNWLYPVIDTVDKISISKDENYTHKNEVKAMIAVEFYWRSMFTGILRDGSKGVILVTENSCVPDSFSYQLDGSYAKYLGVGDFHDPKYDSMMVKSDIWDLKSYRVDESKYTGLPLDTSTCIFTFKIYPSDEMKARTYKTSTGCSCNQLIVMIGCTSPLLSTMIHYSEFETNNGIVFSVSAIGFIIFPFLLFLVYDRIVSRQHKVIVKSAQVSNAIISSLFPASVRDKIKLEAKRKDDESAHFLDSATDSAPIAELYPSTTVLFAGK